MLAMLSTIGLGILLLAGGTLLAAVWTFFLGLGGAPGAMLAHRLKPSENWHDGSGNVSWFGLAVCVIGQSYVALAFCALLVGYLTNQLSKRPDLIGWALWILAFGISTMPASFALKDAAKKAEKKTQDVAAAVTLAIAPIGFIVFAFAPSVMRAGWGWMPFVG
jgi:ABC-type uncharacterized transport system permease subunit